MASRNISIRLSVDGAAEAKAALESFGKSAATLDPQIRSSLQALSGGGDAAGKLASQLGAAAAAISAAQKQLAAANSTGDTAGQAAAQQQLTKATEAYSAALERKRAQYVPTVAAAQTLAKTLADVEATERLGALSTSQASAARVQAQSTYERTTASLKEVEKSSGAAAASVRGLGIQFVQGISGIASGQPIFQTLVQQGHQVVDQSLAMGQGFSGIATAAKGMVSAVGGIPALLGVGVAGGLGAMALAADAAAGRLGAMQTALRGNHDDFLALGQTATDVAKRISATSALGLDDALATVKEITQGRYFSGTAADLDRLSRSAVDLAAVMGGDAAAAAKVLAAGIDDPAKAAQSLSGVLSKTLTPALQQQISLTQRAGDQNKAATLLMNAVEVATKGAARDGLSPLTKAWEDLGTAITGSSKGWDVFGTGIADWAAKYISSTAREINGLREAIEKLDAARRAADGPDRSTLATNSETGGRVALLPEGGTAKIYDIAQANNISTAIADLATRIAQAESGGLHTNADGSVKISSAGAIGEFQLMPGTARSAAINPDGKLDPYKPDDNILLGLRELTRLGQLYNGNEQQIAAAFNAGQGRVAQSGPLPDETQKYVRTITGSDYASVDKLDHQTRPSYSYVANDKALLAGAVTDTSNSRAVSILGNTADLARTRKEMELVNAQLEQFRKNGDSSSDGFKIAQAQADGLKQKEQDLLATGRGLLDNQEKFLRGLQDQTAANAGLTEGEQRILQLRQQMAQIERDSGGTFTPEQRAAALSQLSQQQQQDLARQIDGMRLATAGQDNLAAAYDKGYDAVGHVTAQTAAYTASLKYGLPGSDQQRAAADRLTEAYERQAASANKVAIAQATRQNNDQVTYLNAETASLGMNDNARTAYLAHLQAEQFLVGKNIDLNSDYAKSYLASVDAVNAATQSFKSQEAALNELSSFFDNTFNTISDAIVSAFATGEQSAVKFADVAKAVEKSLEAEFLKLALINPLKNWLLGTGTDKSPTIFTVGGAIGKLLGNDSSSVGSSVTSTDTPALANLFDGPGITAAASPSTSSAAGFDSPLAAVGTVGTGAQLLDKSVGGSGGGLFAGLADKITLGITDALGNTSAALQIADAAGSYGSASIVSASVANSLGLTNETAAAISQVAGQVADALPYVGAAVSVITSLVSGDFRGAGLTAGGALVGAAIGSIVGSPGVGTAIGAAVGSLVNAILPSHPLHPYQNVALDVAGGHLTAGAAVGQLENVDATKAGVQSYADSINTYLDKVGLVVTAADGHLGDIGDHITGLAQTLDPNTLFAKLTFKDATNDGSNYSVAKGALANMNFGTPQDLANELAKIAGFADAASALGIQLASVSTDLTSIQIASVSQSANDNRTTVQDAQGNAVTYDSDIRKALQNDLVGKVFANVGALDDEINSVNTYLTTTLPQLLTPTKRTSSSLQQQLDAAFTPYAQASQRDDQLGLGNHQAIEDAWQKAMAIIMKPALDAITTTMTSIQGRASTLLYGQAGAGSATLGNLAQSQAAERAQLEDQWRQTWGDGVIASAAYNDALQQLIQTQALETAATQQQIQDSKDQSFASLTSMLASNAQRAGVNDLGLQLLAYDAKATQENDAFRKQWVDTFGQAVVDSESYQQALTTLDKAHAAERLEIEKSYVGQSTAQLKQAQGSVASLFTSLKDYAFKLQTGDSSPLSPLSQYDLAKSQFNAVSGAALSGDANSAQQLTSYADALISASRAVNGSGAAFAADESRILDVLQSISGSTDALTNSFVGQALKDQTTALQDSIASLQDEVRALRREVQLNTAQQAQKAA